MPRYQLTPIAKADVRGIVAYLRGRSPAAAKKVRLKLQEAMQRLGEFPNLGHVRDDLADEPVRFWAVYSYLIIYRPNVKPVQIIRVLHGAQDVRKILGRE